MYQLFPKPDRYFARSGHLDATVVKRAIPGAPDFMRGLRALFVTDVHVLPGTTAGELDAFAEKLASLSPDLLLLGGDYSDWTRDALRFFEALAVVRPPLGGFGVIGNNDAEAWKGRLEELRGHMARAGVEMLCNGVVRVPRGDGIIHISGLDEHLHGRPDAARLLSASPDPGSYRILLSHYPVDPDVRPELMLCGHTHGGQFNLLGLTPFAVGFERFKKPRVPAMAVSGLHDVEGMRLLVSKGVGASRLQWRIGVRPEVDLLVFE